MLIPLKEILTKYGVNPKGVIHVGAHWAEEHDDYVACGIERFVYIEPCAEAFNVMKKKFIGNNDDGKKVRYGVEKSINKRNEYIPGYNIEFIECEEMGISLFNNACGSESGEMPMYVSHQNQGQSNSLLRPEGHLTQHPEIIFDDAEVVKVVSLDSLPIEKDKYDMLVMDCQGFEGEVLKGAKETLKHIDIIYTEINRGQTYSGNMEIEEMKSFLNSFRFSFLEEYWPSPNWSWGDGIFIKQ